MRIFVLGAGATGSLLAQLLERQGHTVWCGDRDLQRAHHFLGKSSSIAITDVNARNLHGIVRAARGSHNPMQVPGVHVGNGDAAALAQKVVSALQIAVTAPDRMSLPL